VNRQQRAHWLSDGTMYGGGWHLDQQGMLGNYQPEQLQPKRKRKHVSLLGGYGCSLQHGIRMYTVTGHEALPRSWRGVSHS
tara:strand:+ start:424 stop:666 length:243 start_codon:yes stop_codon:yes gene_type:complete